jgi:hypothetical protein
VRLRGAAMSSSRAVAQAAAAQLAPRSAIAQGPRNAMHGMSAAGTRALRRLVTVICHSALGAVINCRYRRRRNAIMNAIYSSSCLEVCNFRST